MATSARPVFPAPLVAGGRIVVTAPSSGVPPPLHRRLDLVLQNLRTQGFVVEEGQCLRDERRSASAPARTRADELMASLLRDDVAAIIPPWGGELAIELLDRLDWAALAHARPKWLLGYSDTSTLLLALTLRLGWATAHGPCLMDLAPGQADPLTAGVMAALALPAGSRFEQRQSTHWQKKWTDFALVPETTYQLTEPTQWRRLPPSAASVPPSPPPLRGRLIGGCLDTLMHTAGTAHGNVAGFIAHCRAQGEGVLLYLENAEQSPPAVVRALHRLRWAGWLEGLAGVLVGRSAAPEPTAADALRYDEALAQTLAALPCPVLMDMDIGHRPPQMLLINGARAEVASDGQADGRLTQWLA
jgi:muramoyltetrapeptide carboxypeptidase LdcA involved in peptidoglycan recycling